MSSSMRVNYSQKRWETVINIIIYLTSQDEIAIIFCILVDYEIGEFVNK